jgi:hypothetical protein
LSPNLLDEKILKDIYGLEKKGNYPDGHGHLAFGKGDDIKS